MGENLENIITLEPVGNQMVDGLLALEGGNAGGASHELPNNGSLTTARGDRSHWYERHAESSEEPNGRQKPCRTGRASCLGVMQDGGRAETSGRPSVQSLDEELIDEASFQPELPA